MKRSHPYSTLQCTHGGCGTTNFIQSRDNREQQSCRNRNTQLHDQLVVHTSSLPHCGLYRGIVPRPIVVHPAVYIVSCLVVWPRPLSPPPFGLSLVLAVLALLVSFLVSSLGIVTSPAASSRTFFDTPGSRSSWASSCGSVLAA
jgi:hypothetical protein